MPASRTRPLHLRPWALGLVFLGGSLGTAARAGLDLAIPDVHGIPVAILGINVFGAFLLGLLLDSLARSGPDAGRRRVVRLLCGTGMLGGFTTYSALAADTADLLATGLPATGIAYAAATLVLGLGASCAGILLAGDLARRRSASRAATSHGTRTGGEQR